MYCKLGKQVLIDVVLDYLERKSGLQPVSGLSVMERAGRLRERIKSVHDISILEEKDDNGKVKETIQWDDWDDDIWGNKFW